MTPELKIIIFEEKNILKKLLESLDEQYELIISKDILGIDKKAKELEAIAKELASIEIKRRNVMGNETSVRNVVEDCEDETIQQAYEDIKQTLKMIEIQKDSNSILIKQNLFFTKKMMNCIKPQGGIGTYNSNGQVGK